MKITDIKATTASAPPYAADYQQMASSWLTKFFVRGDCPKFYVNTEAEST